MARRRVRIHYPGSSNPGPVSMPKKSHAMQIKKPKTSDLKKILSGYVTASETDRTNALAQAVLWYEDGQGNGAIPFVMSNSAIQPTGFAPGEFRKKVDIAAKCRARALGTTFPAERDTSLRMAIKAYEACCEKLGVPKVETYIQMYDAKKIEMDTKVQNLQAKYGDAIGMFERALGLPLVIRFCTNCNEYRPGSKLNGCAEHVTEEIKGTISKLDVVDGQSARSIDLASQTLRYNKETAKDAVTVSRHEGILISLLRELPALVRYSALEKSADGTSWVTNRDKHMAFHTQAMSNLEAWLKSDESPNRLVRKGVQTLPTTPGSRPQRTYVSRTRTPLAPGQLFATGTNNEKVHSVLKDGQWHDLTDFATVTSTPQIAQGVIKWLTKLGPQHNYVIEQTGNKYRLIQN